MTLELLEAQAKACTACRLAEGRTQVVFGEGNPNAHLMFVGEGPGEEEDKTGRPFVGKAGQLLDRILQAAGIPRESVYITNIVMCRPPENRAPRPGVGRLGAGMWRG
jgi:DNA polymerase